MNEGEVEGDFGVGAGGKDVMLCALPGVSACLCHSRAHNGNAAFTHALALNSRVYVALCVVCIFLVGLWVLFHGDFDA